jgi:hypothetical protein
MIKSVTKIRPRKPQEDREEKENALTSEMASLSL